MNDRSTGAAPELAESLRRNRRRHRAPIEGGRRGRGRSITIGAVAAALLAASVTDLLVSPPDGPGAGSAPTADAVAVAAGPDSAPPPGTVPVASAGPGSDPPVRDASLAVLAATTANAPPAPTRLVIPDVGIDMPITPVGVGDDGQMAIPDDVDTVGRYRFGSAPGSPSGSTVLASHVDSWAEGVGPFARLRHDVRPGMVVNVTSADGAVQSYRVADNRMVPKPDLPVDVLFDRSGPPRLLLITCGGRFQRDIGRYTDNVVVTAVPWGA